MGHHDDCGGKSIDNIPTAAYAVTRLHSKPRRTTKQPPAIAQRPNTHGELQHDQILTSPYPGYLTPASFYSAQKERNGHALLAKGCALKSHQAEAGPITSPSQQLSSANSSAPAYLRAAYQLRRRQQDQDRKHHTSAGIHDTREFKASGAQRLSDFLHILSANKISAQGKVIDSTAAI